MRSLCSSEAERILRSAFFLIEKLRARAGRQPPLSGVLPGSALQFGYAPTMRRSLPPARDSVLPFAEIP